MWQLLQIELFKIFRKPRSYISFAAITILIGLVLFGLKVDGNDYMQFMLQSVDSFDVQGKVMNGYLVCYIILQLMLVHVPLLVTLVAADMISGENNAGTLRALFIKPYSRTQIILAKFFSVCIYTFILLVWVALLALFGSMFIFGTDDMFIMKSDYIVIIDKSDVFWRYCLAFGFAFIALVTVASVGFFFSSFAENSIGPIITTMSVIVLFTVIGTLDLPVFRLITPYFFTTNMINWREFFDQKVNSDHTALPGTIQNLPKVFNSLLILVIHIIVLTGASVFVMKRKDILT